MRKHRSAAESAIKDWLMLNMNELSWMVILVGVGLCIGLFIRP